MGTTANTQKSKVYWTPQVDDVITGVLVNSGSGLNQYQTVTWKYQIDTDNDITVVTAPKMLQSILSKVQIGTVVRITYKGLVTPNWSKSMWAKKTGVGAKAHPYHYFVVEQRDLCPTCGSHTFWKEVVPQKIKNAPVQQNIHNPQSAAGETGTQNDSGISQDLKQAVAAAIAKTQDLHKS